MIHVALPVLFMIAWCVLIANWMANVDAKAIAKGQKVDHASGLVEFVILVGLGYAGAGIWATVVTHNKGPLYFLLFAPMAWAAFTMSFRYLLNRKRGLDWRYCSPSSWYDLQFLKMVVKQQPSAELWIEVHHRTYVNGQNYFTDVHRAGFIAYCFEGTVFLASLLWIISQLPTDH